MKTTKPQHIEAHTMRLWLDLGSVTVTSVGDENTYAINEFGHEFYAKDVPDPIVCNQCGAIGKPYANCNGRCDAVFTHKIDAVRALRAVAKPVTSLGVINMTTYVRMTDKFMSGWGAARNARNVLVIECGDWREAEAIERAAQDRPEMLRVSIVYNKPKARAGVVYSWKHFKDMGGSWLKYAPRVHADAS